MPALTDLLCTRCGLCCGGSLFADVELASRREASAMEAMGLAIDDDVPALLLQPCAALKNKRCSIYRHRPNCCRTFECNLLKSVQAGAMTVPEATAHIDRALAQVARIKKLLSQFPRGDEEPLPLKERCQTAIALTRDSSPHAKQAASIENAFNEFEKFTDAVFLRNR
jgi:hypothetical protein